ncbi:MAG: RHS repeat-associated core domain-containing protein, partial [Prevotellaceae bacterium]|nr:RHS repeat-associated core domain-containing protein [Prevotellaceae bacterium]
MDSSMPTTATNRWRFAGKEIQPLGSTGWIDFGARQYDSFLGRWTTVDPLAEKYPGISPYLYCAGNPVNYVDPDGNSLSTHTDKYGVVQRVIDDGDLGVYRHDGDAEQTISELDSSYSSDYTSGGGELMGKSLHALSFVDMNKYHSTGVVESLPIKIDFESNELTDMVTRELEKDYSVMNYQRLAAPGGALDSKSKINNGSKLFDTYASPRDAGNFLAGMYAASKGTFGPVIMYGYGAYNLCGNNKEKTAIFCLFSLMSTR